MHIRKPLPEELPRPRALQLATAVAILAAVALTVTIILPAERGIDPTGIGTKLNLTRMGQLKAAMAEPDAPPDNRPSREDELAITLEPGQGQEIKMEMTKGFTANYQWKASAPVYHDTHGDPYANEDIYISYSLAEGVEDDSGSITAIYGGHHGWYWVNRGDQLVTIQLQTSGEYLDIEIK